MHQDASEYLRQLRSHGDALVDKFIEEEHTAAGTLRFLNYQAKIESFCVDRVTEDYIIRKRLGVGKQLRSIMADMDRSLKGIIYVGGFNIYGRTTQECVDLIRQQADELLQASLEYVDRLESYSALFGVLPNFNPQAA